MSKYAWWLQFRNQFLGFLREPAAAMFNIAVPILVVAFQAFAFGDTAIGDELPGYRLVDILAPIAAIMFIMTLGLFAVGIGLASMIESRTIAGASLRVGGVWGVVSTYLAVLGVILVVGVVASTLLAIGAWGARWPDSPLLYLVLAVVSALPFFALGVVLATASSTPKSAQGVSSALFFPLLFMSGAAFPVTSFPTTLQTVSSLLPGFHVNELLSAAYIAGLPFPWLSLVYLTIFTVIATGIGLRTFARRDDI